ncbi:hypothetical protein BD414DRAFT_224143 [Trametes punicea]|nr:hypothetical protein BD414DRAFT_224143 [Trametes punicea]
MGVAPWSTLLGVFPSLLHGRIAGRAPPWSWPYVLTMPVPPSPSPHGPSCSCPRSARGLRPLTIYVDDTGSKGGASLHVILSRGYSESHRSRLRHASTVCRD